MSEAATQQAIESPLPLMVESGVSLTFKVLDPDGNDVQITLRDPLRQNAPKVLGQRKEILDKLIEKGWTKVIPKTSGGSAEPAGNGAPTCRVHGVAMKPSRKPGSFFCSKKLANGDYCAEKVGG